jgi:hypothetical protein
MKQQDNCPPSKANSTTKDRNNCIEEELSNNVVGVCLREAAEDVPGKGLHNEESRATGRAVVFRGKGATVVTIPTGTKKDGEAYGFCTFFRCPSGSVVPRPGAGLLREAGKEVSHASGRVIVKPGSLAGAGAAVVTIPTGPGKNGEPAGFCIIFKLGQQQGTTWA